MSASDVWVAKDDGSDIIRAAAIVAAGRDYNGNVTVRLAGGEQSAVTLVAVAPHEGQRTPEDFHHQLIRVVAELSDAAGFGRGPSGLRRTGRLALGHRPAVGTAGRAGKRRLAPRRLAPGGPQAAYWM